MERSQFPQQHPCQLPQAVVVVSLDTGEVVFSNGATETLFGEIADEIDEFDGSYSTHRDDVLIDAILGCILDDECQLERIGERRVVYLESDTETLDPAVVETHRVSYDDSELLIVMGCDISGATAYKRRLDVLHHVLRHRLRTELNVIDGYAEKLCAAVDDDELIEVAERVRTSASDLVSMGESAIEASNTTIEHRNPSSTVDVSVGMREAIFDVEAQYPRIEVTPDLLPGEIASVDRRICPAVTRLLSLIRSCSRTDAPRVDLSVESSEHQVTITCSTTDIAVFDRYIDDISANTDMTALDHPAGLDGWMIDRLVAACGGTTSLASEGDRTLVTVRIPTVSAPDGDAGAPDRNS